MIKVTENLASNLTLTADGLWEHKAAVSRTSRGTLQATAFGAQAAGGPSTVVVNGVTTTVNQANPFFIAPPGFPATKQTIRYDFDALLGPGATSASGDDELVGDADLLWDIDGNWNLDFLVSVGRSDSYVGQTKGVVNTGQATLDLNGTNQSGGGIPTGSATSTAVPSASTIVFQSLNAGNALDVWNPAATNRTSAATIAALLDPEANNNLNHGVNSYQQFRLTGSGTLLTLPAGPLKIAAGLEQYNLELYNYVLNPQNAGPSRLSSNYNAYNFYRRVTSEFVELDIPVVSQSMNIPFMQKLEVDLSGRHDGYSDVGATTNPKVALNWDIVDGLRFRSSWSTSFVAVALEHDLQGGLVGNSAVTSSTPGALPRGALSPGAIARHLWVFHPYGAGAGDLRYLHPAGHQLQRRLGQPSAGTRPRLDHRLRLHTYFPGGVQLLRLLVACHLSGRCHCGLGADRRLQSAA